jgi:hypothetical protein
MAAQPLEDPSDPLVILRNLPVEERAEFLRQYQRAVDAAHDPAGYDQLRRTLQVWSLATVAVNRDGYQDELAAVRAGTASRTPVSEAIPDWDQRAAEAKDRRHGPTGLS